MIPNQQKQSIRLLVVSEVEKYLTLIQADWRICEPVTESLWIELPSVIAGSRVSNNANGHWSLLRPLWDGLSLH